MLKCADIGHLAAAPADHKRWAYQLEEEFFQQVLDPMMISVSASQMLQQPDIAFVLHFAAMQAASLVRCACRLVSLCCRAIRRKMWVCPSAL